MNPPKRDRLSICPVCARPTVKFVRCTECHWSSPERSAARRQLLATVNPVAAKHAYTEVGCNTCSSCREQFRGRSECCPLRMFHDGLLAHVVAQADRGREPSAAVPVWERYLREWLLPEETEEYWASLMRVACLEAKSALDDIERKTVAGE